MGEHATQGNSSLQALIFSSEKKEKDYLLFLLE